MPGVPDLLLFMPAEYREDAGSGIRIVYTYHALGIEMKTATGRQSQEQKDYQKMFEAASYKYVVVRSLDDFKQIVNDYIAHVDANRRRYIASAHVEIIKAQDQREKEKFYKIIGKK